MKKTRLICLIVILILSIIPVYANNENNIKGHDSLSYSQEEYNSLLNECKLKSDEQIIERTCEVFLTVARASVRDDKYSPLEYITESRKDKDTILYRLSEYDYLKALYADRDYQISDDNITFDSFKCSIIGNKAEASVVETYTYHINDEFNEECFRMREYFFKLEKCTGIWLISDVVTNDACEQSDEFEYKPIDIKKAIVDEPILSNDPSDEDVDAAISRANRSSYEWSYEKTVAVNYARDYFNHTNSFFGANSSDCQNFASQCVWAGLRGSYANPTSQTALPAVKKSLVPGNVKNAWYRNVNTEYYNNTYLNWTWDNVCGFSALIKRSYSNSNTVGPKGNTTFGSLNKASKANVISYDSGGNPNNNTLDHAMFVTKVTGTFGNRTKDNIMIAAHSSATNSAYQSLSSYTSYSASCFARSYISAGYYPSPRS